MKSFKPISILARIPFLLITIVSITACEDFVDIDPPETGLVGETVFDEDVNALAAINGVYSRMVDESAFFAGRTSISVFTGVSSDELLGYSPVDSDIEFAENELDVDNGIINSYWRSLYEFVYSANSILEGLNNSPSVTDSLSSQWQGEAKFIRAWCYFYLVNLWGDVPLALTTDFQVNSLLPRVPVDLIYEQIVNDLLDARLLMNDEYPTDERIRPNKAVATALLARVYLYLEEWELAEEESTTIIEDGRYALEPELENVFLNSSTEAIWQFEAILPFIGSGEGLAFILSRPPRSSGVSLRPDFLSTFEDGDIRESAWVGTLNSGSETFFYPFKYKVAIDFSGNPINEYQTVFRLAEVYLIRAESRARQNNFAGAREDINTIRLRAQLAQTTANNQTSLLNAIELERKHELFTEMGHRWFDLKRTQRATEVISLLKPDWQVTDVLWPIPLNEFLNNPNLGEQNLGY